MPSNAVSLLCDYAFIYSAGDKCNTCGFHYIRYPVVAMGVLRWLEHLALEPSFFKVASDSYIVYLILLDEVCH